HIDRDARTLRQVTVGLSQFGCRLVGKAEILFLTMDFHVISDYRALLVAHWLDFGNSEAFVTKLGKRFLHRVVQLILQRRCLLGRREYARIYAVDFAVALLANQHHLSWSVRGKAHL